MSNISEWKDTAASNSAASPNGFPEGMAPSGVNDSARELMAAVRRQWEDSQWFNFGINPTLKIQNKIKFASSSYTITDIFEVGRRVRVVSNNATVYGKVATVSSSSSARLVGVTLDSGTITSTVTQVDVGILTPNNVSYPQIAVQQTDQAAMEAETDEDKYVPPDLVKYSPGVAKAWVRYDGDNQSRGASYNISTVSYVSVGVYEAKFTTAFSSANYCAVAMGQTSTTISTNAQTDSSLHVVSRSNSADAAVEAIVFLAFFGDQ